jgi:hypothetical protein
MFFIHTSLTVVTYILYQYHQRLFTLDTQITHLQNRSFFKLGTWMLRRWTATQDRKKKVEAKLGASDLSVFRDAWIAQKAAQTKPLPSVLISIFHYVRLTICSPEQSQKNGLRAAESTLAIMDNISIKEKEIYELEHLLISSTADAVRINMDLQTSRQLLTSMKKTLTAKLSALGVEEKRELKNLKASPYLRDRMNACALKHRIRDRLRQRKFELDRLQHDYRQTINGKLHMFD